MINNILTYLSIGMIFLPDPITTAIGIGLLLLICRFGKRRYSNDKKLMRSQKYLNR